MWDNRSPRQLLRPPVSVLPFLSARGSIIWHPFPMTPYDRVVELPESVRQNESTSSVIERFSRWLGGGTPKPGAY